MKRTASELIILATRETDRLMHELHRAGMRWDDIANHFVTAYGRAIKLRDSDRHRQQLLWEADMRRLAAEKAEAEAKKLEQKVMEVDDDGDKTAGDTLP